MAISLENTEFYRLAMFDGLTGLYVRRQFDARLSEDMARISRYGGELSVLRSDIDHFKQVNDTYGHVQGDIVLQELSKVWVQHRKIEYNNEKIAVPNSLLQR